MSPRQDDEGRAYAGSQRQTQTWVNERPEELNKRILVELPILAGQTPEIVWRSPLKSEKYREYRDNSFLGAVDLPQYATKRSLFWPAGGPRWDALASYQSPAGAIGVILVEGKSYPTEVYGGGCKAGQPGKDGTPPSKRSLASRLLIEQSLRDTQRWLGMTDPPDWTGPLYQHGNRLAHVYWLRETLGVDTWLVHLLFVDDPHKRTTEKQWRTSIKTDVAKLGLSEKLDWHANLILPALD